MLTRARSLANLSTAGGIAFIGPSLPSGHDGYPISGSIESPVGIMDVTIGPHFPERMNSRSFPSSGS
jgi:hypothetical protein